MTTIRLSEREVDLLRANRMNDHEGWETINRKIDAAHDGRPTIVLTEVNGGIADSEVFYGDVATIKIDWDDLADDVWYARNTLHEVRYSALPDATKKRIIDTIMQIWPRPVRCEGCGAPVTLVNDEWQDEAGSTVCDIHYDDCGACQDGESHPHWAAQDVADDYEVETP